MTTPPTGRVAAVELLEVRKNYARVEALRGVSLTIERGEVVAMLGPNGAGKTTVISLMLGMRRPTAGHVRLFGLDPGDRAARSRCGVMLQESGVNDVLRVAETVAIFRAYYPRPLPTGRVLELAGLEEVANRKITALSGGQRQRLYYALAVCGDPEALFLDEPTAMSQPRAWMWRRVGRSLPASGTTRPRDVRSCSAPTTWKRRISSPTES